MTCRQLIGGVWLHIRRLGKYGQQPCPAAAPGALLQISLGVDCRYLLRDGKRDKLIDRNAFLLCQDA